MKLKERSSLCFWFDSAECGPSCMVHDMFLSFVPEVLQAFMTSLCNTGHHNATQYLSLFLSIHNVYYWSWMILVWSEILAKSAAWRLPMQSFTRSCHSNNWSPLRNARRTADQQSPGRFLPLQDLRRNAYVYIIMVWFIYVLVSFNMAPSPTTLPLVVVGGSCGRLVVITTDSSAYTISSIQVLVYC